MIRMKSSQVARPSRRCVRLALVTVRHTATDQWLAVISVAGEGADAYSFDTQAEAQAWCEARVAELAARKRR